MSILFLKLIIVRYTIPVPVVLCLDQQKAQLAATEGGELAETDATRLLHKII